jgi:hypothetical protein
MGGGSGYFLDTSALAKLYHAEDEQLYRRAAGRHQARYIIPDHQ